MKKSKLLLGALAGLLCFGEATWATSRLEYAGAIKNKTDATNILKALKGNEDADGTCSNAFLMMADNEVINQTLVEDIDNAWTGDAKLRSQSILDYLTENGLPAQVTSEGALFALIYIGAKTGALPELTTAQQIFQYFETRRNQAQRELLSLKEQLGFKKKDVEKEEEEDNDNDTVSSVYSNEEKEEPNEGVVTVDEYVDQKYNLKGTENIEEVKDLLTKSVTELKTTLIAKNTEEQEHAEAMQTLQEENLQLTDDMRKNEEEVEKAMVMAEQATNGLKVVTEEKEKLQKEYEEYKMTANKTQKDLKDKISAMEKELNELKEKHEKDKRTAERHRREREAWEQEKKELENKPKKNDRREIEGTPTPNGNNKPTTSARMLTLQRTLTNLLTPTSTDVGQTTPNVSPSVVQNGNLPPTSSGSASGNNNNQNTTPLPQTASNTKYPAGNDASTEITNTTTSRMKKYQRDKKN